MLFGLPIAAAAPPETAWEYRNSRGDWTGALTEALVWALEEADGNDATWRSTALRVRELVNVMFPGQHPQVEGPATRLHFSMKEMSSQVLLLKVEDDTPVIQAGAVAGIAKGNRYSVAPLKASRVDARTRLAEATVTHVTGFRALVELSFSSTELESRGIPRKVLSVFWNQRLFSSGLSRCKLRISALSQRRLRNQSI
jgi:hypothetical protein